MNNRYQIFNTIATGGMAVIYAAQDLLLERKVALKILKRELSEDQSFHNKFRSEAKASANLNHPNIITTYDFGFDGHRLYIVMELIDGSDLKDLILHRERIDLEKSLDYMKQAASGLSYAHEMGFIHCDVKPQNMLVDTEDLLKITDFGVARAIETITRDEMHDVVWGSPYYISPEQSRGDPPTPASDVYSLGVITYELATGTLPFDAENASEILKMHRTKNVNHPISLNPAIPPDLNRLILKSLDKDPEKRPRHGGEFLEKLLSIRPVSSVVKGSSINNDALEKRKSDILSPHQHSQPKSAIRADVKKPIDWQTVFISFLALLAIGGLIPFWIYVIFSINR